MGEKSTIIRLNQTGESAENVQKHWIRLVRDRS